MSDTATVGTALSGSNIPTSSVRAQCAYCRAGPDRGNDPLERYAHMVCVGLATFRRRCIDPCECHGGEGRRSCAPELPRRVGPVGLEPTTYGLKVRSSAH